MKLTLSSLAAALLLLALSPLRADDAEEATRAQWRAYLDKVAVNYKLVGESNGRELTLLNRSTYTWARSGPNGGSYGSVYVWTDRGTAEAVACFWRYPKDEKGALVHELHSLSPRVIRSATADADAWKPKAGLARAPVPEAPPPADSAAGRLQQMRAICRDFAARSVSAEGERTELRLLPQPLYRYASTNPDVVDGAVFAYVCSIGTDPEVFLLLEAIKTDEGNKWHYALARFSHMDLFVSFKEREVWQAVRDRENTISHNADNTYWVFHRPFRPKPGER